MHPPCTLSRLADGSVLATCVLGPGIVISARLPRSVWARYLRLQAAPGRQPPPAVRRGGAADAAVAGIFDDIAKGFSSVVKNKWVKTAAAGVLSLYGVPPGVTTKAMESAGNLVDMARGDPRAQARLARIAASAVGGDPTAQRAMAAVQHVQRARGHADRAVDLVAAATQGNAQARARLEQIAAAARRDPNGPAGRAANAVRAAVQASRQPGPPAIAHPRPRPAPPVVRAPASSSPAGPPLRPGQARVVSRDRLPDGRRRLVIDVAGELADLG